MSGKEDETRGEPGRDANAISFIDWRRYGDEDGLTSL